MAPVLRNTEATTTWGTRAAAGDGKHVAPSPSQRSRRLQGFFNSGTQDWLNIRKTINVIHSIYEPKKQNHIINSVNAKKVLDKIQHPFLRKTQQTWVKRELSQPNNVHLPKPSNGHYR